MNIFEQIVSENTGYDGTAVTDHGIAFSYPALFRDVRVFAETLKRCGILPLARVGIVADDSYEYIVVSLAVLSLNAAIVPLSTRATKDELSSMPGKVGINDLILSSRYRHDSDISLAVPETFSEAFSLRILTETIVPVELPDGKIPAFIRFSSGTTGANKGVVLSHDSVLARTSACVGLGVTRGEHVLWVLDMAFHFVVTILLFLRKGAVIVICGYPVESRMRQVISAFPIRLLYATPFHYRLMTNSPDFQANALSGIRLAISTAMKLELADARAFRKKFSLPLMQAYGIIEIGLPCINTNEDESKYDSAGRVQDAYEIRISEPDAEKKGAIQIRGEGMFDAYLTPFRTLAELCPDGWFSTGDIGYLDSDRYLFIVGRSNNVINFAGMKIFPYEIERVLNEFSFVSESRVSGEKTPGFGELPVAEIVLNPDAPANWVVILRQECYRLLAAYKVPKRFTNVDFLPKTASGKLLRRS